MSEQPDHPAVPLEILEEDETVAPRPEESAADEARAERSDDGGSSR